MDPSDQWKLPSLKSVLQINTGGENDFYDAKFCPFTTTSGSESVVAVVGHRLILVLRFTSDNGLEVIQAIEDKDEERNTYHSCAWTRDLKTGNPLLCVGGSNSKINILDVLTGQLIRTLVGHGASINDLVISPTNQAILASASEDATVRIWSLEADHEKHACAVICAGEGHRGESIQTMAFHPNGRYLLSGGIDHIINLWGIPELPDSNTRTGRPTLIHYPLFSTSQVHSNIVDCVAWHGDLILSKAFSELCIVLWRITGFSSDFSIPKPSDAPSTYNEFTKHADTRSAFHQLPPDRARGDYLSLYERLLQLHIPDCDSFYMRFSLSPPSSSVATTTHPILMIGNSGSIRSSRNSKVFFWDLARFDAYHTYISSVAASNTSSAAPETDTITQPKIPHWLPLPKTMTKSRRQDIRQSSENTSVTSLNSTLDVNTDTPESTTQLPTMTAAEFGACKKAWDRKYGIGDPQAMLGAHRDVAVAKLIFTARQCAWSPEANVCLVVGSEGNIALFRR